MQRLMLKSIVEKIYTKLIYLIYPKPVTQKLFQIFRYKCLITNTVSFCTLAKDVKPSF